MQGISTVDGFVETTERLAEMIKYVANEPSVGLFYVQQHTQNAVPNVLHLKSVVTEKSRDTVLHTEDLEDSVSTIKSMKDCGTPIADDMIQDIRSSLALMSRKQPRRGVIPRSMSGLQIGKSSFRGLATWEPSGVFTKQDGERGTNYFSTIFRTAKDKASNLKWPQIDSEESVDIQGEKPQNGIPLRPVAPTSALSQREVEFSEPHMSTSTSVEPQRDEQDQGEVSSPRDYTSSSVDIYDDFKADREAKLEEWLGATCDNAAKLQQSKQI